jgi:rhamnose utilization protein RhaD (predicted bifunctional aldolase and dehydrogenase)
VTRWRCKRLVSKIHVAKRGKKAQQPPINKRINAMMRMGLEKSEREILAFEVSDAALEIAAGTTKEKVNFTLGACTGLSECPG